MADMSAEIGSWTCAALSERLVRYTDLIPCYNAFIDCRSPGSEAKENFTIIGPGVSENPAQHVHIAEPHGYNIGGARQPPGCVNSQHSHETAEVFVVHSGHWRFDLGENGEDAQIALAPGDMISIPTQMFRGFTATQTADDGSPGFLWAVLGQDNPGRVTWAPKVFEMASDFGLVLMENGSLIDTTSGATLPANVKPMKPTSPVEAARLNRMTANAAETIVWRNPGVEGTDVVPVIGKDAPLGWDHGFDVDRVAIAPGDGFDWNGDGEKEVLFVDRGSLFLRCADGELLLKQGDTISLPANLDRSARSEDGAVAFLVYP
jgi:mannose-6-phosphate isomerase-like protein (cupin superfamily)